jgi:hypothetical protein
MSKDGLKRLFKMLPMRESETGAPDPSETVPNWLEEDIGAAPLWSDTTDYTNCRFCLNCYVSVAILATEYTKRDAEEFKYKHLREVTTLYHIDPAKLTDDYTPKDNLNEAIKGCPLCSLAIGTSWFREDLPFDTARWARNPLWRKRAQNLIFNMYRPDYPWHSNKETERPLCQIIYGTNLTTDLYPEADMSEFWGAIHLWTRQKLKRWYDRRSCGYSLTSTLGAPPKPTLCSSTGDPEVLNIAEWWLRRCLGEHGACSAASKQADDAESPARLLFVGSSPDHKNVKLFINDRQRNGPTLQYLTLSYCWGKREFPRLTEATQSAFSDNIDTDTLPATFQHAIQVTRRLGFSYIWIDALCIIQDSKSDWLTESVKMGSIYRNSVLTIAALGAADCFQGCFLRRNPLCYRDIPLSNSDLIFSSRAGSVEPGFKREFEVLGPAASPLQTRAWCVQEQLLSPRTLFFGFSGVFWQCIEYEADEACPLGTRNESANLKGLVTSSLTSQDFDVRKTWRAVLERYTGCKLTYPSDKLVAISGIARLLARTSGEEYVAGMWKRDIWHDLLWHSQGTKWTDNHLLERLDNGSPMFSWASVGQPIWYFKYDAPDSMHLEATSVMVESSEKGNAPEHTLRITTQLREVVLLPPAYSKTGTPRLMLAEDVPFPEVYAWSDDEVPMDVIVRILDSVRLDWTVDRKTDQDLDTSRLGSFSYAWILDIPLDGSITRAWYMCLARQEGYDPLGAVGLIVVPTDADHTSWKRIGFLWHSGFYASYKNPALRGTVQNTANNEIDWEETAKHRAPNPFLLNSEKDCVEVVLV